MRMGFLRCVSISRQCPPKVEPGVLIVLMINGCEENVLRATGQCCDCHLDFFLRLHDLKLNQVAPSLSDAVSLLPRQVLNYCLPQLRHQARLSSCLRASALHHNNTTPTHPPDFSLPFPPLRASNLFYHDSQRSQRHRHAPSCGRRPHPWP
jgi:hypothetical protein